MTRDEKVKHWISAADNDLVVADGLIKMKQNLYTGFMCQQAIEKIIKAYFIKEKNEDQPHIHNLLTLSERSGLYGLLDEKQISFIIELTPFNIERVTPNIKAKSHSILRTKRRRGF